jgi:hypothetical protein
LVDANGTKAKSRATNINWITKVDPKIDPTIKWPINPIMLNVFIIVFINEL